MSTDLASVAVIENREHLVNLLAEAAEIEHNLMCCYLYAAFSLKQGLDEDLTADELEAVSRWRREILRVAIDEMAHLALVANISAAIGGTPHLGRANFPISPGYLPAGVVVRLAPFDADTLDHFIYLERPETSALHDGKGFAPASYRRIAIPNRLMPTSHDYATVGELYRAIDAGLARLAERDGERALFIGDPAMQLGGELAALPGLTRVRCLKTAREALAGIITQGEGAAEGIEESHYCRFKAIRDELRALRAARPSFEPARPAAQNPVMRSPLDANDRVWVERSPAAEVLDLVNAAYTHMLRLLAQSYAETRGLAPQRALVDAAVDVMRAITPLGSLLARLPARPDEARPTAGMSFAMIRDVGALPAGAVADRMMIERLGEIRAVAERLAAAAPEVAAAARQLAKTQDRLVAELARDAAAAPAPAPAAIAAARAVPVSTVADGIESVDGAAVTLRFEARRCIHARHCVLGQPSVFKANVVGPWLDPDSCTVDGLVTVAHMCPSGAITYLRKDGGPQEPVPPVNLIQVRENGPLGLRGELTLDGKPIGYRATLCRCGASKNKPFCDGSHATIGFTATGEPATRASEPLARRNGPLEIRPQHNGPLELRGNVELCAGTGRTVDRLTTVRLCRCGHSANKPFCDGSHARVGFEAD